MPIHADDPGALLRHLREARRYQALASAGGLLLWSVDPHLRPTGRNPAWEQYTGQSYEQYVDLGWLDAIRERDRDRCLQQIQSHVPREEPFTIELGLRRFDGVHRRHLVRAMPVRDEHGVVVEWMGTAVDVEDARAASDAYAAVQERLRLTYDAAHVGTWEWLPTRGELQWSDDMFRLLGLAPGETTPSIEAFVSAMHPDDVERATREWVAAMEHADAMSHEFRIVRPDQAVRWMLSRSKVIRDEAGQVVRVLGLNMDVTEQRRMEQQMAEALEEHRDLRDRLVALTDGAEPLLRAAGLDEVREAVCALAGRVLPADGYAIWALDRARGTWSAVSSRGLGEGFVGQVIPGPEVPFTEPLVADDLQLELLAARAAAYREEGIRSLISVPLPVEGVRRATLVAYYRTPHVTTRAERQVAVALGHLAAAALGNAEARARQEQLRAQAEEHSRRMTFLADASTLFSTLDVETAFRRLTELSVPFLADWCAIDVEQEGRLVRIAVAHPDAAVLHVAEELHRRYPPRLDESSAEGRVLGSGRAELHSVITDEMLADGAADEAHSALLRALRIRSAILAPLVARGQTLGVLTLVSSTTGRHFDEADLQFVELVAKRAGTVIDNARLYEEARRANQAKDEFLALLSHELRTPLNAIMGWTQVLQAPGGGAATPPTLARGLEVIQRNARLQSDLVDGLLDVARVATGGLPLALEDFIAADATAAAVEAIRPSAAEKGLLLQFTAESPAVRVFADPNRFHQIVTNLLTNAVKFTDRGGRIDVRVRDADGLCEIEVADTGAGIGPEFLPHVFERFRQADSSATRRHGGLGLGLWLVQELARAHGGSVQAASPGLGMGSTFTVRLPRV